MKKILAVGLISFSLSVTLAQAKFFVGVQGGYDDGAFTIKNGFVSDSYKQFAGDNNGRGWNLGVDFGSEWFFGDYIGLRNFIGLGYGQSKFMNSNLDVYDINVNLDVMFNAYKANSLSIGVFVGAGAGVNMTTSSFNIESLALGWNIPIYARTGLTFGIGEHHRIDLSASLPLLSYSFIGFQKNIGADLATDLENAGIHGAYNPIRFTLGYRYIF